MNMFSLVKHGGHFSAGGGEHFNVGGGYFLLGGGTFWGTFNVSGDNFGGHSLSGGGGAILRDIRCLGDNFDAKKCREAHLMKSSYPLTWRVCACAVDPLPLL